MSDLEFYPAPPRPNRSLLRWLLLFTHAALFALLIYSYPALADKNIGLFTGNTARILIPIWGGILALHLVMVMLRDTVEGIRFAYTERKRLAEYRRLKNRRQLLQRFAAGHDTTDTPEVPDDE